MSYVPLQVISSYSLLQSPVRITDLITEASKRGYQALALTDKNVLYGAVEFYDACLKANIKPIIGLTLEIPGLILNDGQYNLVLIAKNQRGYANLLKISTLKMTLDGLTFDQISGYLSDLFIILPPLAEVNDLLLQGRSEDVVGLIDKLKDSGIDNQSLKLGVDYHASDSLIDMLSKLAADTSTSLVADSPVDYINATDYFPMQVLKNIAAGTKITNVSQLSKQVGPYWLRPADQVASEYRKLNLNDALTQVDQIVDQSNVEIKKQQPKLPQFDTPNGIDSGTYLRQLCEQGLKKRLASNHVSDPTPYQHRLERELSVIHSMGFDNYFLIVWDVINFAHQTNIITGPGRGSAAGSLVAYVLTITDVDPIKYDLLFERFLNPERVQMPDIDLDIPDDKRDEVIQYVHQKYGHKRVAQIITFGTLAAKQSIRDVGRVFGLNPAQQDVWSKAIPSAFHVTLRDAYDNSQRLKNLIADSPLNQALYDTASVLEGLPRHYSTHAAGLVLSDQPLVDLVALQNGNEGLLMTQYSKDYVESVGLLKMDFLGLRNLTILADALDQVKQSTGQALDISAVPLDDSQTIALFAKGNTTGIFQFESNGIRNVLRRLVPTRFEDIALVNALYRPGPMQNIDEVVKRKTTNEALSYPDESLEEILKPTYGVIVYQEQVMLVASKMAGFSLGQADILRRAMSKKKLAVMGQMKVQFMAGSKKRGYPEAVANKVFDYIERFANYGFNKSHAVAYSKMAYELAFLKVHYPGEFHVALLNSVQNNAVKIKEYLLDAKSMGVTVLGPDINTSQAAFSYQDDKIIFGLESIKGVRHDMVEDMLAERREHGPFKSFPDFLSRLDDKYRKSELISALIYSGALDGFSYNRSELIAATPEFISSVELSGKSMSLFKVLEPKMPRMPEMPLMDKLEKENEYIGAYLSGHPTERFETLANQLNAQTTQTMAVGMKNVYLILYVTKVKIIRTKTGKQMAFLDGNDQVGETSITVFPNLFSKTQSWLHKDMVVLVKGNVEKTNDIQMVANDLQPAANALQSLKRQKPSSKWYLRIDAQQDKNVIFHNLNQLSRQYHGNVPVIVFETETKKTWALAEQFWLTDSPKLKEQLITIFGNNNVVYK
ncbi:DNA polymerase III subunit alpha [Lentilactobacillus parabuchneri]|uniref:DNA polymerase III subunit alpha n=1 Tax=Lentilactobacillus parabuchneri TaxID=152331 RepID=UPI0026476A77|nr:DNA polymerase III subunit alpha [Lentilactobacillus parabuchneri]MDN6435766.1 DNA polymerase III subunit alpha [Lentilactobacillus parabuchneri]